MNNSERLSAIGNSIKSIGKDLMGIVEGFFNKSPPQPAQSAKEAPVDQPENVVQPAAVAPASSAEAIDVEKSITVEDKVPQAATHPAVESVLASAPAPASLNLKVCSRCKVKKPLDNEHFHRDSHKISGFRSACRECSNGTVQHVSCNGCGVSKPLTPQHWQRNSKAKSGFRNPCKECLKKPKTA